MNSMEQKSRDFCPNYVQEYLLDYDELRTYTSKGIMLQYKLCFWQYLHLQFSMLLANYLACFGSEVPFVYTYKI